MAVTFTEARRLAEATAVPRWNPSFGTLTSNPRGYQDPTHWWVTICAREFLDGDTDFILFDWPAFLVDKTTGQVTTFDPLDDLPRLDTLTEAE